MIKLKSILTAVLVGGLALATIPAMAQDAAEPTVQKESWSFAGVFGNFDKNQLQRGFQVFREVCSNCHSMRLLAFRNLAEPGGPEFTEGQVKELAAQYQVDDATAAGGKRAALPSDFWPSPFPTEQDARDANGGALPPDMSVLAKSRGIEDRFPNWLWNFFTTYSEGGPDYIHALMNGYRDTPPDGFVLPDGKFYNDYFPGHAIGMPPPLSDGQVTYTADESGKTVPLTTDQYSRDVAAFLMWMSEPHMTERKADGFKVLLFLFLFAVLMYLVKRRIWSRVH